MKLIQTLPVIAALACLPMAARELPPQPPKAAAEQAADTTGCNTKGCPEKDPNGNPPLSCTYQYGMATGFRCILECTYKTSQWGTIVATSNCN